MLQRILFIMSFFCCLSFVFAETGTPINQIVAIVNNDVITQQELDTATDQSIAQAKAQNLTLPDRLSMERQVLQGMIMQKIALQLAKLNNITVTPDEVNAAIAEIAKQHELSVSQMYQKLSLNGVDLDAFKTNVKNQIIIQKLEQAAVGGSIIITSNEIDNYLATKARLENANTEYEVQHILISLPQNPSPEDYEKTKQKAEDVLAKIKGGLPFTEAAMTYSNSSDALSGGELGYKTLDQLPASFAGPLSSLKVGEVSALIPSDSGYNIIKLVNVKNANAPETHYVSEYHVLDILVKVTPVRSSAQAQALLSRLRLSLLNGVPFSKVAEANSQDTASNQNGGDLGWVNAVNLNPLLAAHIQSLPLNTLSQAFQTSEGWYLIKVIGVRQVNDTLNYEREQAKQAIFMEKANEALQAWQSQIRGASYIQILDPQLMPSNS